MNVRDFTVKQADGSDLSLNSLPSGPILIVNVASKCGLTPQYEGLEKLYETYAEKGLSILGFPCNQFAGQEPGTADEIAAFCTLTYGVKFPVLAKIEVNGAGADPLYVALKAEAPTTKDDSSGHRDRLRNHGLTPTDAPEVLWNFEKFLVSRDGASVTRFGPASDPASLASEIEAQLV